MDWLLAALGFVLGVVLTMGLIEIRAKRRRENLTADGFDNQGRVRSRIFDRLSDDWDGRP